jgi:hypothetical protein
MGGNFLEVETPQPRDSRSWIRVTGAGQHSQYPHGLFEFRGEDLRVVTVLEPPLPLPADVRTRRSREADPTLLQ